MYTHKNEWFEVFHYIDVAAKQTGEKQQQQYQQIDEEGENDEVEK